MAAARGAETAPPSHLIVAGRRVAVGRLGPELERIRRTQSGREYYTHDHLLRLAEFQARVPWGRASRPGKQWCKQLHGGGKDCKLCSSCHFCRCAAYGAWLGGS